MADTDAPVVGLIHATPLSVRPIRLAMADEFPEARPRNVLDDSLLSDLQAAGTLTDDLALRMRRLIEHLLADGVAAVQLACSGYAPLIDSMRAEIATPIRKPDEAMYADLAESGLQQVGIIATVEPALDLAVSQLEDQAAARDVHIDIRGACRPEAMAAAQAGDDDTLRDVIVEAAQALHSEGAEILALAQYSLSPVADAVAEATGLPVRTGPHAAVRYLRDLLSS